MESPDIRRSMILQLDTNVDDLIVNCTINKSTYELCSQKAFWLEMFEKYDYKFPNLVYNNPAQWIKAFKREEELSIKTNKLVEIIKNPQPHDFEKQGCPDIELIIKIFAEDPIMSYLYQTEKFNMRNYLEDKIFDKINDQIAYHNGYRNDYIELLLSSKYGDYYVDILAINFSGGGVISHKLSYEEMKELCYEILSCDMIPINNYGYKVKL
jgi:hypothetical protein